jgi:CRP-like cAMP-binding protein
MGGDERATKRRLKELAAALKAEPGSIPRRLELAAALRDAGRPADAIELFRGVAEVYAEEGRLVQAMAVCKGILEIDPDHRETLEMLATLAQRRGQRRGGAAQVRQADDGRWVAEPTDVHGGASAAAGGEREHDELTPARVGVGDDGGGAAPEETSAVRRAMWAHTPAFGTPAIDTGLPPLQESEASDDLASAAQGATDPQLEFPPEVRARARGDRLLEIIAEPSSDAEDRLEPTVVSTPEELVGVAEEVRAPALSADGTRAATPGAIAKGLPRSMPSPDLLPSLASPLKRDDSSSLWPEEPDDSTGTMVRAAMAAPLPRPQILVEPPPFPLLSELPREAFLELLSRLTLLRLHAGEIILREGEIGDACYLVASGAVRVEKAGPAGPIELAVLGPGSFFGEFAVLADQRRHASVMAIEPVELLEIRRALLDELVSAHPGVARTLRRFYRERLLSTLTATAPFFAQLTPEERASVVERFRPRRFGRGSRIIEEGSAGGGLYLILVGEVQVVRSAPGDEGGEVVLGTLGEGAYFGEMSLLRGGSVASATVRAARTTEVVQLPPRDFYEVVSQHPVLWDQLRSEAERRAMANHAILAGEARKSEDGSVYLV